MRPVTVHRIFGDLVIERGVHRAFGRYGLADPHAVRVVGMRGVVRPTINRTQRGSPRFNSLVLPPARLADMVKPEVWMVFAAAARFGYMNIIRAVEPCGPGIVGYAKAYRIIPGSGVGMYRVPGC